MAGRSPLSAAACASHVHANTGLNESDGGGNDLHSDIEDQPSSQGHDGSTGASDSAETEHMAISRMSRMSSRAPGLSPIVRALRHIQDDPENRADSLSNAGAGTRSDIQAGQQETTRHDARPHSGYPVKIHGESTPERHIGSRFTGGTVGLMSIVRVSSPITPNTMQAFADSSPQLFPPVRDPDGKEVRAVGTYLLTGPDTSKTVTVAACPGYGVRSSPLSPAASMRPRARQSMQSPLVGAGIPPSRRIQTGLGPTAVSKLDGRLIGKPRRPVTPALLVSPPSRSAIRNRRLQIAAEGQGVLRTTAPTAGPERNRRDM